MKSNEQILAEEVRATVALANDEYGSQVEPPPPRIVFFGMEITLSEATDLLSRAAVICSLIPGVNGNHTANWSMVLKWGTEFQEDVMKMHTAPGRVLVRCAACGGSVGDNPTTPYARVPNPWPEPKLSEDAASVARTVQGAEAPDEDGGANPPASVA